MPAGIRRPYRAGFLLAGLLALLLVLLTLSRAGTALVVSRPAEPPDAIVMLASHEWERLPAVVELATMYPASTVVLTVPSTITDANCHQCAGRRRWLMERRVADERIQELTDDGRGTHGEASAVRRYAERHQPERLAIVTSPYHTRRALATFREALKGLPVEIGMYPACGTSPASPARWWAEEYDRAYVAYEWAATLYYRVKYGVPLVVSAANGVTADAYCSMLKFQDPLQRLNPL